MRGRDPARYHVATDRVVVAGDLNDTPDSKPLAPLLKLPGLQDVLALQFPDQPRHRWIDAYGSQRHQVDDLLKAAFKSAAAGMSVSDRRAPSCRGVYCWGTRREGGHSSPPIPKPRRVGKPTLHSCMGVHPMSGRRWIRIMSTRASVPDSKSRFGSPTRKGIDGFGMHSTGKMRCVNGCQPVR